MVRAVACRDIHAPPERVSALYRDYTGWRELFPATIRGTRLLSEQAASKTIEVDHVTAGKVINVMTILSPGEIQLEEWKPRYQARFLNRFEPSAEGTRYTVIAEVALKGGLRLLGAVAAPIVRRRMERFVLIPVQLRAEAAPPREPT